jgi:hypothetical protein
MYDSSSSKRQKKHRDLEKLQPQTLPQIPQISDDCKTHCTTSKVSLVRPLQSVAPVKDFFIYQSVNVQWEIFSHLTRLNNVIIFFKKALFPLRRFLKHILQSIEVVWWLSSRTFIKTDVCCD